MNRIKAGALLLLIGATVSLVSCDKDEEPKNEFTKAEAIIYTMTPNPDNQETGTAWLQTLENLEPKKVSNANAHPIGYGLMPLYNGDDIYTFPSLGETGGSLVLTKWTRKGGDIVKVATMPLTSADMLSTGVILDANKGYLTSRLGKIITFNPTSMTRLGEINLNQYAAEGLQTVMLGQPFIHEGLLYISLIQLGQEFNPKTGPQVELAIIDIKTDKVVKVIKEDKSGISIGNYPYGEPIFVDEKGDMYFLFSGMYSMLPDYKTGFLRIKKGETEFDPTYSWVLNDQEIEGETSKTRWAEICRYVGNGKLYAQLDMPNYWANPNAGDWFNDKSVISVEMDLYKKTIKKLDIPPTSSYAVSVDRYKDLIVFSVFSKESNGFYTYNPATGEASKEAVIKVDGYPFGFHTFSK